jgi:hypothetical protein
MGAVAARAPVSTSTSTSSCFEGGEGWGNQERRCCMVKVRPDVEAYRSASVEGMQGKWVCVNDILPMSDYDLEVDLCCACALCVCVCIRACVWGGGARGMHAFR